jgi:phosphoglycerate dehydrogenase-like enzyme
MKLIVAQKVNAEMKDLIHQKIDGSLEIDFVYGVNEEERARLLSQTDILLAMNIRRDIHDNEFRLLEKTKLVQITLAGADIIPYDRFGPDTIICSNSGAYSEPIAEHAIGMMLALARNFLPLHNDLSRGGFDQKTVHKMLGGSTLGIIGFGGIGKRTAEIAQGFGMKISAINRNGTTDGRVDFVGSLSDLNLVLHESDFVLLTIALNRKTRNLIGKAELEMMKPDAVLVNVARGELVDEKSLYDHLKTHPLFKAGIEAWWIEPFNYPKFEVHYPFFDLDNFLGSPHNSYLMEGIHLKALEAALENILRFVRGETPQNIQNREDYF